MKIAHLRHGVSNKQFYPLVRDGNSFRINRVEIIQRGIYLKKRSVLI